MSKLNTFVLSEESQESILQYYRAISSIADGQYNFRNRLKEIDLAYLREMDQTIEHQRAKQANRLGDTGKFQNITVPVIKPQVEAAVGYQAAVFLTDYPIFGITADPQYIDAAKQMQALVEENSTKTSWAREFLLFFHDGARYNISAIELAWDKKVTAALETDLSYKDGKEGKPVEIIWQGNVVERWDMYNTFWDYRCLPADIPEHGEFVGNVKMMSRTALKTFLAKLDGKIIANINKAFNSNNGFSGTGTASGNGFGYYQPVLNPDLLIDSVNAGQEDWSGWLGLKPSNNLKDIAYKGAYEVTKLYLRLIPSEHNINVPAKNTPQIWKIYIINHSVIVYAELQTNAHEKIPVLFGTPAEDGLGYQAKSLADDALPFQSVASALMNSVIHARRRAVMDRVIYDPSRISEAVINSPNPAARMPVRPNAYGKPISESVYAFPFRDDTSGMAMSEIQAVVQFGNVLNGQNAARQGQFVKGNKTDGQWENVMQNATSKDQRTALMYEAQVFTPFKEIMKLNYMQYQSGTELYSPSADQTVKVDPVALRKAIINFKVTDGLLPKEKMMSTDTRKVAMQIIGSSPTLAQGYNIAPMFSYIMMGENVNLTPFEKSPTQQAYEQAVGQWQALAQLAIQKGARFDTPQPTPQQFGYDPNMQDPANQAQATQGSQSAAPGQQ